MRALLHAVLCILFIVPFVAAARHDVAVDPDGTIYSISLRTDAIVISKLAGDVWKEQTRLSATSAYGSPAIAWTSGGLLAAWTERAESGAELAVALIQDNGKPALSRCNLPFGAGSLALEDLGGSLAGIFVTGEQAKWLEIDVRSAKIVRDVDVTIQGSARFPSILPGSPVWITWEERNGGALSIAAAKVESGQVAPVGRFSVRGFGSVSMPILAQGRGPSIVWQGVRAERPALFMRSLSEKGFGSVQPLPAPVGPDNVLQPRRAVGSLSIVSASSWNSIRWSATQYDLSSSQPRAVLRTDEKHQMLRPVVVAGEEETWLWTGADGSLTKSGILSERVFDRPAVGPTQEDETRYLAFGDSITAGKLWLADSGVYEDPSNGYEVPLQELHGEILGPATVMNAGVSGENTIEGLARLQLLLEVPGVYDRVLLLEGTNDWTTGEDSVLEVTIPNLTQMVALIYGHGAIPIVGTLLPRDRHPLGRTSEIRAKAVTKAMIPVMQRLGVRIARFQEFFPLDDEHLADDDGRRLHPTLEGYALMAKIWMGALLTFEGDVNRDGKVDFLDAQRLSAALGTRLGNFLYSPDGDMNLDGIINIFDLSFVYGRFGIDFFPDDESSVQ